MAAWVATGGCMKRLFVFGAGFSAAHAAALNAGMFDTVTGTTRSPEKFGTLSAQEIKPAVFDGTLDAEGQSALAQATHLLVSIAPSKEGDPVLNACSDMLASSARLQWVCYLSTVGVYGNHDGAWVTEQTECKPVSKRSKQRIAAERAWQELCRQNNVGLSIFRLSGIYGPGRNTFVNIGKGTARRLVKPGQVFNRIHRDDIAQAFGLAAKIRAEGIFNITDDKPAPPQDVVAYAYSLAGKSPPHEIDFESANLTPMARSFYGENKRVSNAKSKRVLGRRYEWPDYRTALSRMWEDGSWEGQLRRPRNRSRHSQR